MLHCWCFNSTLIKMVMVWPESSRCLACPLDSIRGDDQPSDTSRHFGGKWGVVFLSCGRRWPMIICHLRDICFQQDIENTVLLRSFHGAGYMRQPALIQQCAFIQQKVGQDISCIKKMLFSVWSFHKSGHMRQSAKLFSEIILLQPFVLLL